MADPAELPSRPPSVARPSGIPRMSRLPVPLKPTSSNTSPRPKLRAAASASTLKATNIERPTNVRKPLNNTIHRAPSKDPSNKPKAEDVFKKPLGRPASRQARERTATNSSASTQDCDGGAFRSSSSLSMTETVKSEEPVNAPKPKKSPRPSLSDRTVESLAHIPASPRDRRRSSFFSPQSPMAPSRPRSSLASPRRPGSSDSNSSASNVRSSTMNTRAVGSVRPSSPTNRTATASTPAAKKSSTVKSSAKVPLSGSKTMHARPPSSRPGLDGLFDRPPSAAKSAYSNAKKSVKPPRDDSELTERKPSHSSAALREQIRQAKMQHRRVSEKGGYEEPDFDLVNDPFNQRPKGGESVLSRRIADARMEGRLNIAALGLREVPTEVLKMYDFNSESGGAAWGEFVDLSRFTAADNDIDSIPDEMFPDTDEDDKMAQFGGLLTIDLHGNLLSGLPLGFRRLEMLTALNLTRNKFVVQSLDIISELPNLQDLKLADNELIGALPTSISRLQKLEVLELQGNKLDSLPESLKDLLKLRVLNVSNNRFTSLPMAALCQLPLADLVASKNLLRGALFDCHTTEMATLQRLVLANNQLTLLADSTELSLPSVVDLDISFNRISMLPDVSSWASLTTFIAEDNKFSALPAGFTTLQNVKTVNLTGNDIARLDPQIASMDGLTSFQIEANPIRERKFLSMDTDGLKEALKQRLPKPAIVDPLVEVMGSVDQK